MSLPPLTEAEIANRLVNVRYPDREYTLPPGLLPDPCRSAAVLIPFLRDETGGGWRILFTRRTDTLADHKGQVAFPGGRYDPGDPSPEATALREAYEEIGLESKDVRVLGRLADFRTITNFCVTPVVGVIPWPYPLRLAAEEVSRAFTIPLGWLADEANYEIKQRQLPDSHRHIPVVYFKPFDGEVLWGISGTITLALLQTLKNQEISA